MRNANMFRKVSLPNNYTPQKFATFGVSPFCDLQPENPLLTLCVPFVLLFQETGLKHDTAAVDFAIHLLWVVSQTDALHLCASLDDH